MKELVIFLFGVLVGMLILLVGAYIVIKQEERK